MIGGAANAEQPTAQGAQRGVKGQSAPLQNPEHRHYRKRREKRPDADMQQHQHNGQRTARVQTKEPHRTLGVAPMDIDNTHDVLGLSLRPITFPLEASEYPLLL